MNERKCETAIRKSDEGREEKLNEKERRRHFPISNPICSRTMLERVFRGSEKKLSIT